MAKTSPAEAAALRRLGTGQATAAELVAGLRGEGYGTDAAVEALISLQGQKKVAVVEPKPYASVAAYALSPLSTWFWAVVAAVALSLALTAVTSGAVIYLRYVFGSILVLFLPGYALIEALYPKRDLDELTRFALSIGLSLALVPLVGLLLNYTPFGIRLVPVSLSIAGLTVVLAAYALVRKHAYYRLSKGVS
jgi:Protein of unknown function (DUF1616)